MMYWNGDWSWAAWLTMTVGMLLFWGILITGVVLLVRGTSQRDTTARTSAPEQILAERFARGEIDADEYRQAVETIRVGRG